MGAPLRRNDNTILRDPRRIRKLVIVPPLGFISFATSEMGEMAFQASPGTQAVKKQRFKG